MFCLWRKYILKCPHELSFPLTVPEGEHMHERTEWPKNSIRGCAMWPLLMKTDVAGWRVPIWQEEQKIRNIGYNSLPQKVTWLCLNICRFKSNWIVTKPLWWISSSNFPAFSCVQCSHHKPKQGKQYLSLWVTGLLSKSKILLTIPPFFILALMNRSLFVEIHGWFLCFIRAAEE